MRAVNPIEKIPLQPLLDRLPIALRTPDALMLLKNYFLIPQYSIRYFVLTLLARIVGKADSVDTFSDLPEAEYLLTLYAQLSTEDMRDKMLALVRQICTANRGDNI